MVASRTEYGQTIAEAGRGAEVTLPALSADEALLEVSWRHDLVAALEAARPAPWVETMGVPGLRNQGGWGWWAMLQQPTGSLRALTEVSGMGRQVPWPRAGRVQLRGEPQVTLAGALLLESQDEQRQLLEQGVAMIEGAGGTVERIPRPEQGLMELRLVSAGGRADVFGESAPLARLARAQVDTGGLLARAEQGGVYLQPLVRLVLTGMREFGGAHVRIGEAPAAWTARLTLGDEASEPIASPVQAPAQLAEASCEQVQFLSFAQAFRSAERAQAPRAALAEATRARAEALRACAAQAQGPQRARLERAAGAALMFAAALEGPEAVEGVAARACELGFASACQPERVEPYTPALPAGRAARARVRRADDPARP